MQVVFQYNLTFIVHKACVTRYTTEVAFYVDYNLVELPFDMYNLQFHSLFEPIDFKDIVNHFVASGRLHLPFNTPSAFLKLVYGNHQYSHWVRYFELIFYLTSECHS